MSEVADAATWEFGNRGWSAELGSVERVEDGKRVEFSVNPDSLRNRQGFGWEILADGERVAQQGIREGRRWNKEYVQPDDEATISETVDVDPDAELSVRIAEESNLPRLTLGGRVSDLLDGIGQTGDPEASEHGMSASDEAQAARRELRDRTDSLLEEADDIDADEWNTDARADGTIVLQDPDSNKTRTIEPDDDSDSIEATVDTFGASDDSQSGASPEPSPTDPDGFEIDERAVAAVVVAVVAIAYGVTR